MEYKTIKYEELLQLSSVIEDAPYILTEENHTSSYSAMNIRGDSCRCKSSSSTSPCKASSLESKSGSK